MAAPAVGSTGVAQQTAAPVQTPTTNSAGGIGSTPSTLQTSQEQNSSCSLVIKPIKWVWETVTSIVGKIFGFIFSCCCSNNSSDVQTTQDIINSHNANTGNPEALLADRLNSMKTLASLQLQEGDTVTEEDLTKAAVEGFSKLPVNVRTELGGANFEKAPRSPENQKKIANYLSNLPSVKFSELNGLLESQNLGERLRGLCLMANMETLVFEIDGLKDEITKESKNVTVMQAFEALPEALKNLVPDFKETPTSDNLNALKEIPDLKIEFAKASFRKTADQKIKAKIVHAIATQVEPHADEKVSMLTKEQITEVAYSLFMELEEGTQKAIFQEIGALDARFTGKSEEVQVEAGRRAVTDFGHAQVLEGLQNWSNKA